MNISSQIIIEVSPPDRVATKPARELAVNGLKGRYLGWDAKFDYQFDDRSLWLLYMTADRRHFLGSSRIVFPYADGNRQPLPMELGDVSRYLVENTGDAYCELSGIRMAKPGVGFQMMLAGAMTWLKVAGIQDCYITIDERDPHVVMGYESFGLKKVEGAQVCYSRFTHRDTRMPAMWDVIHLERELIDSIATECGRRYFMRHLTEVDDALDRFKVPAPAAFSL